VYQASPGILAALNGLVEKFSFTVCAPFCVAHNNKRVADERYGSMAGFIEPLTTNASTLPPYTVFSGALCVGT
jgi:hypothetical protein